MAIQPCSVTINQVQREIREHGTSLFPIGFYVDYLPLDDIPWHWHEELEIGYIEKGQIYLGVNSEKILVKQGEAFLINKEVLHACWCEDNGNGAINSFVFGAELIGVENSVFFTKYMKPILENNEMPYLIFQNNEKWQREILDLFKHMWKSAANEEFGFEFSIRRDMSDVFLNVLEHMSKKPKELSEKAMRTDRRMKTMLRYISENYGMEITIGEIAGSATISESECLRCFRDAVGISPIKYVKQLRIQNAAELLTKTGKSISDIAEQCGFQDMSYFTKSFRETKGVTPSEFRKKQTLCNVEL